MKLNVKNMIKTSNKNKIKSEIKSEKAHAKLAINYKKREEKNRKHSTSITIKKIKKRIKHVLKNGNGDRQASIECDLDIDIECIEYIKYYFNDKGLYFTYNYMFSSWVNYELVTNYLLVISWEDKDLNKLREEEKI